MANPITVSEEFLRHLADYCVPSIHSNGVHGLIDGLEGALGRQELARRAELAASTPEERAARVAALRAQLAELGEDAPPPPPAETPEQKAARVAELQRQLAQEQSSP
jgi:hypothetical protein